METISGSIGSIGASTVVSMASASGKSAPGEPRLTAGQTWGPYHIGRLLGRGGMGEVYEAESLETGRRLALKLLRSRLEKADDRARFLREGQLAASISHPHTVYIFGSEEIEGLPVISMELVPGGTLKERVAANGPMLPEDAVAAVMDIIGGLDAAQAAGVLHRDIKPSNCFIDDDGAVKVGDFGLSISTLARDVHHDLEAGAFQGTPQFAPPEQLRGEPLDIRADIYAVGATLYYLLTGQPPFDARDLRELVSRVTSESPRSPRDLRRGIPAGLAAVVLQCLAKIPGERPKSYADLAAALRPFLPTADLPAKPGLRFLAGFADSAILSVPVLMVMALTTRLGSTGPMAFVSALAVGSLYAFVLESLWGATLGAMLVGVRVRSANGGRAAWWRILIRTAIGTAVGALPILYSLIAQAAGYGAWSQAHETAFSILSSMSTLGITAAMFLTARRENGYASLYDMISGTRIRVRPAERERRVGTATAPSTTETTEVHSDEHIGPFTVRAAIGNAGAGRLLAAYDPVLRRRVWIRTVPPGTPPIAPPRRDISRVTRLHWLTGRRSATENWDAFEAPSGGPLLKRNEASLDWPAARVVFADLLHEFAAALKEGSLPPLGLDRLWMRADGRTVLLDFEAPGVVASPSSAAATPMELLASAAGRVTMPGAVSKDLAPRLPLSACVLLRRWSHEATRSLEEAQAQLRQAAASLERVSRWRRAVPIAMAAAPFLFIGLSALVVFPNADVLILTPEDREVIGLLTVLRTDVPPGSPPDSPMRSPEYRVAVETYLAGQHGALLRNTPLWSSSSQGQEADQPELRRMASDIATRYPSVTAEELARSRETIQPVLDRIRPPQSLGVASPGVIVLNLMAAMASLMALFCSIVSSIAVPGGVATRLIGLAVVTRDGNEIGRLRSLARTLIAWAPILAWLLLLPNPIVMGFGPASPAPVLASSLAVGAMIAGVMWTIAAADRGLQDRIAGTWVVPR
ncbi:MAG TPA: protein kinase [Terriglobia bacterium]|nr:protein kinase [Terriglobia bacterium]